MTDAPISPRRRRMIENAGVAAELPALRADASCWG